MTWVAIFVALLGVAALVLTAYQVFQTGAPPEYERLDASARGDLERRVRAEATDEPDGGDVSLLRTAAGIMVAQRYLSGFWLGCFLIQFATTLGSFSLVHLVITGLFTLLAAGLALFVERRAAAGAAFLGRHAAAGPIEPSQ